MQPRTLGCAIVIGVFVALFGIRSAAQSADPIIGTWVLNVAKLKFSPGPAPKSESRTYVVAGKEIKATSTGVGADGKPTAGEWMIVNDGRDTQLTGNPDAECAFAEENRRFLHGVHLEESRQSGHHWHARTISRDGSVMTITNKGTNAKGQPINDVLVFEKR